MSGTDRAAVWRAFGEPSEQVGSANDPRVARDAGVDWNEKWVYYGADGALLRVVLWERHALKGIFRIDSSGAAHPERPPEVETAGEEP